MNISLKGRVALVTGGSKGIGKAISRALAEAGASVSVGARGRDAIQHTVDDIHARGARAIGVGLDVTDSNAVNAAVKETAEKLGGIDILVCDAGGAVRFGGFGELSDEDWRSTFDLNVMGVVRSVRAAEPYLRKSKTPRIIIISSISGLQPGRFNPHYTTTKAAVINLSKHLANIYSSERILVNVVCPGPTHSNSWDESIRQRAESDHRSHQEVRDEMERQEISKIPLGRVGEGEDLAPLVVFLASDQASWITGSCFHVDGGKLASMS